MGYLSWDRGFTDRGDIDIDLINLITIYYHIILSKWYASEPSMVPAFKSHCETCANTRVHILCPCSGHTIAYAHLCACFKQSKRLNACPSLKKASLYWKTMHGRGHLPYLCEDCILNMLGNGNCDAGAPRFIMKNIKFHLKQTYFWPLNAVRSNPIQTPAPRSKFGSSFTTQVGNYKLYSSKSRVLHTGV